MNYIFISNDCVGARIYQALKQEYTVPFIWSRITYSDFHYIMTHYDTNDINYNNASILDGTDNILSIDGKLKVLYVHYIQDSRYDTPTKMEGNQSLDIRYNKISEYCMEHYNSRLQRFKNTKEHTTPLFILNHKTILPEQEYSITTEDCMDFIKTKTKYQKILITTDDKIQSTTDTIVLHKNSESTAYIADIIIKTYQLDSPNKVIK